MAEPELILTSDGSHTLYLTELMESYHSVNGAITESKHVYLDSGFRFLNHLHEITVLEIGFGTGLNCLLTALEAERSGKQTKYFTLEKKPLIQKITQSLNYPLLTGEKGAEIFRNIHDSPWETNVQITPFFLLRKMEGDVLDFPLTEIPDVDLVYFDAFAPEKQPEIWNPDLFDGIFRKMKANSVFVTYCAKGTVRRNLIRTGLKMERLPGPPGKREMLRGIKTI